MSIERFIHQRAIEWFCNEASNYPLDKVFNDILDSKGEELSEFLQKITSNKRQAMRFLELVERTEDIEKWLAFLEHEQKREKSLWKNSLMEEFVKNLRGWFKKSDTGCIRMVNIKLSEWYEHSGVSLSPEEGKTLKIKALRTALYVKLKGIR